MINKIKTAFPLHFGKAPEVVVRSPGRINLIGEHTDYNNGFVLPAAINRNIIFAFSARTDNEIHLDALDLNESYSCKVGEFTKSDKKWTDYIIGVILQLKKRNITVTGFNCVFGGDIPVGSGLSSSAALEGGIVFGLSKLFSFSIPPIEMALIGQAAENEYVGVQCGIMDQFANTFGKANQAIKLDCKDLSYEYFPFVTDDYEIVLIDSGVKHAHASGEYNQRRKECEKGVAILQSNFPEIKSLRDATLHQLNSVKSKMDSTIYKRCKYVIEENERVILACEDLKKDDLISFGKKMFATHYGSQYEFEVSCEEIDFLVAEAKKYSAVAGARMMGGGFGGCTINLVLKKNTGNFILTISEAYKNRYSKTSLHYKVEITDGVGLINESLK